MKKTARELLLARHAAIAPQLDKLRLAVLVDATPIAARQLLPALFRPNRRLWLSLAAAWIVILVINLTQPRSPRPDAETIQSIANWSNNQAQLHALLAQTGSDR
jgi:hypothetical protein